MTDRVECTDAYGGIPEAIGPYTVERQLGAGGMGVVYLASSPTGRHVALKVIRPDHAEKAGFRSRFTREVAAARSVSGAFTASVLDADTEGDCPWLATEFFDSPTLDVYVRTRGSLPNEDAWALGYGLAEALKDIHRVGIVHRDLKPSNVIMAADGPRVIDFGISRVQDSTQLTTDGRIVGTPPYMAPEQLQSAAEVGPAADVFALGAVLVFAVAGHGPFDAENAFATAYNVVHEAPDLSGVTEPLQSIVRLCLKKDPQDRPTPERLLHLLASRRERRQFQVAERGRALGKNRRRRAVAGSVAVVILAVATAAVIANSPGKVGKGSSTSTLSATPTLRKPAATTTLREPAAALRPSGWGTWNTDLPRDPKHAIEYSGAPVCKPAVGDVVCTDSRALYLLDGRTGRIVWHEEPLWSVNVVGVSARTGVVIIDVPHGGSDPGSDLRGIRLKDQKTVWTLPHSGANYSFLGELNPSCIVLASGSDMLAVNPIDGNTCKVPTPLGGIPVAASDDRMLFVDDGKDESRSGILYHVNVRTGKTVQTGRIPRNRVPPEIVPGPTNGAPTNYLVQTTPLESSPVQYTSLIHLDNQTGAATSVTLPSHLTGPVVMAEDKLIVLRADGRVTAVNAQQGSVSWTKDLPWPAVQEGSGPVVAGNSVLVPLLGGRVAALDAATGRVMWISAARNDPGEALAGASQWIVTLGSRVLAETDSGRIYAFQPPK
ncbi:protein kinase [Streptomyces sp. NPDC058864]